MKDQKIIKDDFMTSVDHVNKSLAEVSLAMEAFKACLSVDPEMIKEKMIVTALERRVAGEEDGYFGDLNADVLELLKKLLAKLDDAEKHIEHMHIDNERLCKKNKEAWEVAAKYRIANDDAICYLLTYSPCRPYTLKKLCGQRYVNDLLDEERSKMDDLRKKAIDILKGEDKTK